MKRILSARSWGLNCSAGFAQSTLLGLSLLLGGCSDKSAPETQAPAPSPRSAQKLVIKGSNTIGEELGPKLIAEYGKEHPKAAIELETKGTGSGFWGLIAGVCDIAAASRP